MSNKAVIFYGAPGAGKGTQAGFLADAMGYIHFDSGKYIEGAVNDPQKQNDPVIKRQKKLFLSGKLCDPDWIGKIAKDHIREFAANNKGLIFSGSPRTMKEAFGGGKTAGKSAGGKDNGVIGLLEEKYGVENIIVFLLEIPVTESVKRNSKRGRPGLDEPKIIRIRCREYKKLTLPIIKKLREKKIKIIKIDGKPNQKAVSRAVMKKFKEFSKKKTAL